jgi:diacylglycerol kinase family enzyme
MDLFISSVYDYFKHESPQSYAVEVSHFPRDAGGIIRDFAASWPESEAMRVYAVGGDGILFDCLNGIFGLPNAELAAMPYGRTNNFVRGLGKRNMHFFRNLSLQAASPTIPLDVMHCGGIYALNFCTVGTESDALRRTMAMREFFENGGFLSRWLGRVFYINLYYLAALFACSKRSNLRRFYRVDIDGENFSGCYRGINISNTSYYGGDGHPVHVKPSVRPDDGVLDAVLCSCGTTLRTLSRIPAYLKSRYEKYPQDFSVHKARKITISSDSAMLVNFDDVVYFDKTLTVEVLPRAIRFVDVRSYGLGGDGG